MRMIDIDIEHTLYDWFSDTICHSNKKNLLEIYED